MHFLHNSGLDLGRLWTRFELQQSQRDSPLLVHWLELPDGLREIVQRVLAQPVGPEAAQQPGGNSASQHPGLICQLAIGTRRWQPNNCRSYWLWWRIANGGLDPPCGLDSGGEHSLLIEFKQLFVKTRLLFYRPLLQHNQLRGCRYNWLPLQYRLRP